MIEELDADGEFRGHTLRNEGDDPGHTALHKLKEDIINRVITCVDSRLRSFAEDDIFIPADILDPTNYPSKNDKEDLMEYGNGHFQILTDHFKPLLIKQGYDLNKINPE